MSKTLKWLIGAIIVVVLLLLVVLLKSPSNQELSEQASSGVSEQDKALLLKAIQDPFVLHVRTAIDSFNAGSPEGISAVVDLSKYEEYLHSKFVLMQVNNSPPGGGKDMLIAFTDKPDQFFYVWVYKQGDGTYDLRAFETFEDISSEQAKEIYEGSKPMVEELGLAI